MLKKFFRIRKQRLLRRNIRAGRRFIASENPYEHYEFAAALRHVPLGVTPGQLKGIVPAQYCAAAEDYVRQRLARSILSEYVMPGIILSWADNAPPAVIPAPQAWRREYARKGWRIAPIRSWLRWMVLQFSMLGDGLRAAARRVLRQNRIAAPSGPYVYFHGLDKRNLPPRVTANGSRPHGYALIDWYSASPVNDGPVEKIWAQTESGDAGAWDDRVELVSDPLPALPGGWARLKFTGHAMRIIAVSIARWLTGNWWPVFLLRGAIELAYIQQLDPKSLARDYLFNASFMILRPLWTIHAEEQGARVTMIMYSTHQRRFANGNPAIRPVEPIYAYATWPRYVVWTREQAKAMKEFGMAPAEFIEVGNVDFVDNYAALPEITGPSVAIFDVTPFRDAFLAEKGYFQTYLTVDTIYDFLFDVFNEIEAAGGCAVWKRKRNAIRLMNQRYLRKSNEIATSKNCVNVDPDISARRVIEACDAVISLPFTSTALVGHHVGKPSAYYDPTGTLDGFESWSNGLPILTSREALRDWLAENLANRGHSTSGKAPALISSKAS